MLRGIDDRLNDMILKTIEGIFSDKYFGCSDVHIGSLSMDDHTATEIIYPSSMYYDTRNYTMPRVKGCFQLFDYDGHRLFYKIWKVKQRRNKKLVLPCTKEVTK